MAEDVFGIVGSVIAGAYQVEAVVAEGGFGVVYRAHHVGFRAPIALKCLKVPQQLGDQQEAEFLEQFRGEAELLFRLSASIPTVVRPLHVDALTAPDGRFVPFMALEWLEGETLAQIMKDRVEQGRPGMSLKKLIRLLTPVARALERAHNFHGPDGPISIVHRDLKPENIFLAKVAGEEMVKVLDFGIAKAKSVANQAVGRASQTQSALAAFTPAYGAPEQWLPKRFGQTGPWTDVWGLALTAVELLAQRDILDGDPAAMMGAAIDPERRPTPRNEGIEVPDAVERVFTRALAVDPRDRYRDAGEFWNELLTAAGMRGDEELKQAAPAPARDARAEPGIVPRVETIEAARSLPPGAPIRSSASPDAPTQLAPPGADELALDLPPIPADAPPLASAPPAPIPDLGQIPDLPASTSLARPSKRPTSSGGGGFARELDLDLAPDNAMDLALDIGDDAALARRVSLPAPDRRSPVSSPPVSGSHPAVGRTISGSHPILDVAPSQAPESGASDRRISGRHVAVAPPPARPAEREPQSLLRSLVPGIALVAASVLLTIVSQIYAAATGEVFSLGPIRTTWIAGVLIVAGVGVVIQRLIRHQSG